jgi:hypothetical protein
MRVLSFALSAGLLLLAESTVHKPSPAGPIPIPYPNTDGPAKDEKAKKTNSNRESPKKLKSFSSEPAPGGGRPAQNR